MNGSANSLLDKEEHPLQLGESFERRPKASFHTIRCERLPRGRAFLPARLPSPGCAAPAAAPTLCPARLLRSTTAGLRPRSAPLLPLPSCPSSPVSPLSPSAPFCPPFPAAPPAPVSPLSRSLGARLSSPRVFSPQRGPAREKGEGGCWQGGGLSEAGQGEGTALESLSLIAWQHKVSPHKGVALPFCFVPFVAVDCGTGEAAGAPGVWLLTGYFLAERCVAQQTCPWLSRLQAAVINHCPRKASRKDSDTYSNA